MHFSSSQKSCMHQEIQELPEYEDKVTLEFQMNAKKNQKETTTNFVSFQLVCKDMTMMAIAKDAVDSILRGNNFGPNKYLFI